MTDTKALREIAENATPGEWFAEKARYQGESYKLISAPGWGEFIRVVVRMDHEDTDYRPGVANLKHLLAFAPIPAAALLNKIDALRDALAAKTEEYEALDALVEKRFNEIATLHAALASKDAELAAMRAKLQTIAGGMTSEFPGAPDVMATTPDQFRHGMWTWSQAVARAALAGEGKP